MKIKDFIDKYYSSNENIDECIGKWFSENSRKNGSWKEHNVNFYVLLWNRPLWKFNELYNDWYEVKDKIHEAGAMGDFMGDEPTDEQIENYFNGKELKF